MQRDNLNWKTVTNLRAAAVLMDLEHRDRLSLFLIKPQTVGEVAKQLGEDSKKSYYNVQRYSI